MKEYQFKCPECKEVGPVEEVSTGVILISLIEVRDYSTGPEIYVDEGSDISDFSKSHTFWRCKSCGWLLPCKDESKVIDFLVDQEIDRLY